MKNFNLRYYFSLFGNDSLLFPNFYNLTVDGNYSIIHSNPSKMYSLEGNSPIGDSQQTTVYIKENNEEKGYFILPYDIEDLEILIGKWYNLDGSKTQNVYIKRIH